MDICDYLVLQQADARNSTLDTTNNILEFDVPQTYYTNQRSSTCSVSLHHAVMNQGSKTIPVNFYYMNGGQNQFNSSNNGVYLGNINAINNSGFKDFKLGSYMEILTSPRPHNIRIKILESGNAGITEDITNAVIILKFKYYNSKDTAEELLNQYQEKLF